MGVMTQDNFLFSGTIKDNIRYGKLDATDEEIIAAAKAVNAHDFILKLEKGYDTVLSERGGGLSIGQKQLLAFARTMVSDPPHPDSGRGNQQHRYQHGNPRAGGH